MGVEGAVAQYMRPIFSLGMKMEDGYKDGTRMKIPRLAVWRAAPGLLTLLAFAFFILAAPAAAQDWFRTGTGLGVSKPKVAVADFVSRNDASASMSALFSDVVRNDLDFSGIVELASKSFYPTQVPSVPMELNYQAWSDPPTSAQFLAFGNLTVTGTTEEIQAWFNDVKNSAAPPVVGRDRKSVV